MWNKRCIVQYIQQPYVYEAYCQLQINHEWWSRLKADNIYLTCHVGGTPQNYILSEYEKVRMQSISFKSIRNWGTTKAETPWIETTFHCDGGVKFWKVCKLRPNSWNVSTCNPNRDNKRRKPTHQCIGCAGISPSALVQKCTKHVSAVCEA